MAGFLKTMPEYFQAVIDGRKPFEVRKNDRDFKAGDKYILEEFKGIRHFSYCADYDTCGASTYFEPEERTLSHCPLNRSSCYSDPKDIYTGRRCLIRIKEVFDLEKAGLSGYVAFTFDILNIQQRSV